LTGKFSNPLPPTGWDLFCSGHTFLADGRLLVTGGHIEDFVGEPQAGVYDPVTNSWTRVSDMNAGRWYPTNVLLPNGEALTLAGTIRANEVNSLPQVWQPATNTWRNLTSARLGAYPAWPDYYPFLYVAPNGRVFNAGPQQTARYLDTTGLGLWIDVARSTLLYRDYGSSVMYDDGKVLIVGGNPRDTAEAPSILPSPTAEVIDLNATMPTWRVIAPMFLGRRHLNATLLPDGKVLVTGGSSAPGFDSPVGAARNAELWDPASETWSTLAAGTRYKGYHSNALLLPDGRVLVTDGGHPDPLGLSGPRYGELYAPPYLFQGARPITTAVPAPVRYGQRFAITTPDVADIQKVTWIRLPSATHGFVQNQRFNRLIIVGREAPETLRVEAPTNPNLCPPGDYMLFILNGRGTPSQARFVRLVGN
jgi:hypothetical protein